MSQVDEGLIHAWLDGQLPPDETARVEKLVATDAAWSAAAAEARGLVAASSRLLSTLDDVPSVGSARGAQMRRSASSWWRGPIMSAAAAVVLVVGVANYLWLRAPSSPDVATLNQRAARADSVGPLKSVAAEQRRVPTAPSTLAERAPTRPTPAAKAAGENAGAAGSIERKVADARTDSSRANAAQSVAPVASPLRGAGIDATAGKTFIASTPVAALAGCWEPAVALNAARDRAEADIASGFVLRFIANAVTDAPKLAAPPAVPPTVARQALASMRVQNTVARALGDSTYISEWIQTDARVQLTFTVHGDTLRGTMVRVPGDAARAPFVAVRTGCPR